MPVLPPAAVQPLLSKAEFKPIIAPIAQTVSPIESTPPPVPKRTFQKYGETPTSGGRIHNNPFSPLLMGDSPLASPVLRSTNKRREPKFGSGSQCVIQMDSSVFLSTATSNRSSSDSNKSNQTNDTSGYATNASNTEADHIFFGETPSEFRTRFSSVDTQSSLDSCSELIKCTSPTSSTDLIFSGKSQTNDNRPPVPKRRQNSTNSGTFPKIPPPTVHKNHRNRGIPPVPPARSQTSLDSPRMLQNGNSTRFFSGGSHEMYSKPISKCSKTKFSQQSRGSTQRQDSNLSSDSYSMTSSPGYNSKSMEVPLLYHATRINKSAAAINTAENAERGCNGRRSAPTVDCVSNRQDSIISSDSFSLTSSPGYNTKLIETPLIAHTDKLHTSKIIVFDI